MDRSKIEKKVIETLQGLVAKNKKKEVNLEVNFREELGIDSIQLVSMIAVFEESLNFDSLAAISEVDFSAVLNGNDIVDIVIKYQK